MEDFLVGMDIGTTNTKVIIFDPDGEQMFATSFRTPIVEDEKLGEVLSTKKLWEKIVETFRKIPEELKKGIRAIGISSLGETVFPVGDEGEVSDGMIWYSPLTRELMEEYIQPLEDLDYFKKTGLSMSWIFSAFKMIYMNERLKLPSNVKWLDTSSFIAYKMTGKIAMDRCLASRTLLLNIKTGEWDEDLLDLFKIPRSSLPELVDCGVNRGNLKKDVAEELGLCRDVVVSVAGQDHIAGAFSAGVFDENRILNSTGTTEVILWGVKKDKLNMFLNLKIPGYNAGFHTVPGFYYLLDGLPTGGYCVEWMIKKVLKKDYDILKNLNYRKNPIYFLPFLRGMFMDERMGAGFLNLRDSNDFEDMISSIFESLAFEVRLMMDKLKPLGLKDDCDVIMVGGETANDTLIRIRASAIGRPIQVMKVVEATTLGSATVGGIAKGMFENFRSAFERTFKVAKVVEPDPEYSQYLEEKYENYLKIRKVMEEVGKSGVI